MSILYQGIIVENPIVLEAIDVCDLKYNPVPAIRDTYPFVLFSINAFLSLVWWFITMFTYVYNWNYLKGWNGASTIPFFFMWEHLEDPQSGWTAASYLSGFVSHCLVGFIEVIAFVFYLKEEPWMFGWWVSNVGWWFATVGTALPWLFALFQIALDENNGGNHGNMTLEFSYNAVFLLVGNLFLWMSSSMVHALLGDRLNCHIKATEPERARTIYKKCPIKRTFGQSEAAY